MDTLHQLKVLPHFFTRLADGSFTVKTSDIQSGGSATTFLPISRLWVIGLQTGRATSHLKYLALMNVPTNGSTIRFSLTLIVKGSHRHQFPTLRSLSLHYLVSEEEINRRVERIMDSIDAPPGEPYRITSSRVTPCAEVQIY